MTIYELTPVYDSRKSFYGKAHVITYDNGTIELQSYDTIVSRIINGAVDKSGLHAYSRTTDRHIRDFFRQHGIDIDNFEKGVK